MILRKPSGSHCVQKVPFDLYKPIKEELADVIVNCQNLIDKLCLDVDEIVNKKLEQNEKKYPVEKFKSLDKKYDE